MSWELLSYHCVIIVLVVVRRQKFNLADNLWTTRDHRIFMFHMCIPRENTFHSFLAPQFLCPRPERSAGASSNWTVRLSVHPFVCPTVCLSVCLSVISPRLQTKCNIWSLANDKVTTFGLYFHLWVPHTSLTSHTPGSGARSKIWDLEIFAIFRLCCRRRPPCFTNTCLVHLVTLTVRFDILFINLNLGHNYWSRRGRSSNLKVFIAYNNTFYMIP